MKFTGAFACLTLLSFTTAHAALVSNGDFETTVVTASGTSSGATQWSLDSSNNIKYGSSDTGFDSSRFIRGTLANNFAYDANGGAGGTGDGAMRGTNGNNRPRGFFYFGNDGNTTTGEVTISLDVYAEDAGAYFQVELFGWDSGQTGPGLSAGGPGEDLSPYNATSLNDSTSLLAGTGNVWTIDPSATSTWETHSIASPLNLGAGYDNYAWRIGVVGAGANTDFAVDNLVVIPEPGTSCLLLGSLGLLVVRRRR